MMDKETIKHFLKPDKYKIVIFLVSYLIGLIVLWQLGIFGARWDPIITLVFALINPIIVILAFISDQIPYILTGKIGLIFYVFASAAYYYYWSCFLYGMFKVIKEIRSRDI